MELEMELQKLLSGTSPKPPLAPEGLPAEGEWSEWSPVPFGRVQPVDDED